MRAKRLAYPYVIWMALFVVAPIVIIVIYAFTTEDGEFTLSNFSNMLDYASVFARSLWLALIATVICLVLGYTLAYLLAREKSRSRSIMLMLIMLPMWMNFLLRTYAWMSLLENTGLINRFLGLFGIGPFYMINTPFAVVLGMVYNYLPFMVLPIYSVMIKIDSSLLEAAEDLGARPSAVFRKVIFPLSISGVISGITMVFVPAVSTFAISKLLGGNKTMMLGDLIEMQFLGTSYNPQLGSAIALVMMIIVMICMAIMNKFGSDDEQVVMF